MSEPGRPDTPEAFGALMNTAIARVRAGDMADGVRLMTRLIVEADPGFTAGFLVTLVEKWEARKPLPEDLLAACARNIRIAAELIAKGLHADAAAMAGPMIDRVEPKDSDSIRLKLMLIGVLGAGRPKP